MQRCLATLNKALPSTSGRSVCQRAGQSSHSNWAASSHLIACPPKHRYLPHSPCSPLCRFGTLWSFGNSSAFSVSRDPRRRALYVCAAANRPSSLTLGQRWLSVKHDVSERAEGVQSWLRCAHPDRSLYC